MRLLKLIAFGLIGIISACIVIMIAVFAIVSNKSSEAALESSSIKKEQCALANAAASPGVSIPFGQLRLCLTEEDIEALGSWNSVYVRNFHTRKVERIDLNPAIGIDHAGVFAIVDCASRSRDSLQGLNNSAAKTLDPMQPEESHFRKYLNTLGNNPKFYCEECELFGEPVVFVQDSENFKTAEGANLGRTSHGTIHLGGCASIFFRIRRVQDGLDDVVADLEKVEDFLKPRILGR